MYEADIDRKSIPMGKLKAVWQEEDCKTVRVSGQSKIIEYWHARLPPRYQWRLDRLNFASTSFLNCC